MYARPEIEGSTTTLGVSGMLWRDALVMYDRATGSLWSQVNGKAMAGPMKGERLRELPSTVTTWGKWKRRHPDTLVLAKPELAGSAYDSYARNQHTIGVRGSRNPDRRLTAKTLVLGLEHDGKFAAVPLRDLEQQGAVNTTALNLPLLLTSSSAYERTIGERTLTFVKDDRFVRDVETGSRWTIDEGIAVDGEMEGAKLNRVPSKIIYWATWARFHPETELIEP